jgi:HSP20 family protein
MKLNQKNRVTTPFGDFQIDVENLVEQFFGDGSKSNPGKFNSEKGWTPRISVSESDTEYQMLVELPGVDPADVNLEMQEGRLEISGEKKNDELGEGVSSVRDERQSGEFKRAFEFSKLVEPDQIQAEFKNGLLKIVLPKSEKILPRKINIKVEG